MTRMVFYDYIKLPIFIAEKLFQSFMKSSKQGLCEEEFVENFFKLYMGSFEETATIIFNLLDFDKDGIIKKEDVKIVLSYLPLNDTNEEKSEQNEKKENSDKSELISKIFGTQMKSLEEIDDIVSDTFNKYDGKMNMKQFTEIVTEKNSEVFLQILCFLYEQIPFSANNIEILKSKYNLINDDDYEFLSQSYRNYKKSNSIRIKTPRRSSLLSPAGIFLQKFQLRKFSLNEIENNDDNVTPNKNKKISVDSTTKESESNMSINSSKSDSPNQKNTISIFDINSKKIISDPYNKNIDIVRLDNDNYLENKNNILFNNENKNIKQIVEKSKNRYTSPTKYLQDKSYLNHLAISNSLLNKDNNIR
jgi:Ca2+-binding EF-hand superfamily protein